MSDTNVTTRTQTLPVGRFGFVHIGRRSRWTKAMPFNRTSSFVAVGLLLCLLATPTLGQGPLGFQIFAPADVSTYGGEQEPNEGYFFQYDLLYWSISAPEISQIGAPGTRNVYYGPRDTAETNMRVQSNTLDTSSFDSQFSVGNRIEFGRMEDRNGWLVGIFQQRDQTQNFTANSAAMVLRDPGSNGVPLIGETMLIGNVNNVSPYTPPDFQQLPVIFNDVYVENAVDTWGVEANYLHRFLTCHTGGTFEMFLGARYFEFNDNFRVRTGDTTPIGNVPSFLGGSSWDTSAQNHIVGPQIGLRWFKKRGRWTFSTEGRFVAGLNCQNIHQDVNLGPNLNPGVNSNGVYTPFEPKTMSPSVTTESAYAREFTPMIELRLEGRYQITRAISFHAGWTGLWMDNIARGSSVNIYSVPIPPAEGFNPTTIDMSKNGGNLLLTGLTLGFDINR